MDVFSAMWMHITEIITQLVQDRQQKQKEGFWKNEVQKMIM